MRVINNVGASPYSNTIVVYTPDVPGKMAAPTIDSVNDIAAGEIKINYV